MTDLLETCDQYVLILWGRASKHLELCSDLLKSDWIFKHILKFTIILLLLPELNEATECEALHESVLLGTLVSFFLSEDASFNSDGNSSIEVVTSDHANCDTSLFASNDGVRDFGSERVLETIYADQSETSLQNLDIIFNLSIS